MGSFSGGLSLHVFLIDFCSLSRNHTHNIGIFSSAGFDFEWEVLNQYLYRWCCFDLFQPYNLYNLAQCGIIYNILILLKIVLYKYTVTIVRKYTEWPKSNIPKFELIAWPLVIRIAKFLQGCARKVTGSSIIEKLSKSMF